MDGMIKTYPKKERTRASSNSMHTRSRDGPVEVRRKAEMNREVGGWVVDDVVWEEEGWQMPRGESRICVQLRGGKCSCFVVVRNGKRDSTLTRLKLK